MEINAKINLILSARTCIFSQLTLSSLILIILSCVLLIPQTSAITPTISAITITLIITIASILLKENIQS